MHPGSMAYKSYEGGVLDFDKSYTWNNSRLNEFKMSATHFTHMSAGYIPH